MVDTNSALEHHLPSPRRRRPKIAGMDVFAYTVVGLFAVATLYPFVNVTAASFTGSGAYVLHPWSIIPRDVTFIGYQTVLRHTLVLTSYRNTIITTVGGTIISMVLTILTAYPLSRPNFRAKPFFVYMIIVTMLFNGGLIPNFYLVRSLGMYDTLWALMVPGALSAFNVILLINFFKALPGEIFDSARMDGASEWTMLIRIVLPLSLAILATLTVFYAVGKWNSFFHAIIYIRSRNRWTMQLLLREIIVQVEGVLNTNANPNELQYVPPHSVRFAAIVVTVVPIIMVYPFLQKYFMKGVMVGSIKG